MKQSKALPKSGKNELSIARSSAAEYLTFVAAAGQGGVEAVFADENVWLTQKMMGQLYDVDVRTINYHLKRVFNDSELDATSVIQNFRITAADGKSYNTRHFNLIQSDVSLHLEHSSNATLRYPCRIPSLYRSLLT